MSAAAGRMASKVGSAASKVAGKAAESGDKKTGVLQKGAKKDPELYVCSCVIKPDYIQCTSRKSADGASDTISYHVRGVRPCRMALRYPFPHRACPSTLGPVLTFRSRPQANLFIIRTTCQHGREQLALASLELQGRARAECELQIPVPPWWGPQCSTEGCAECLTQRYCAQREFAKGECRPLRTFGSGSIV